MQRSRSSRAGGDAPNTGKTFENRIHTLLSLRGVSNLTREKHFGSKRVDLYFEEIKYGSTTKYAVECKDESKVLTKSEISKIASDYQGLLDSAKINHVLIVSRYPLPPSALSYIDERRQILYQTEDDLRNTAIDFRNYLMGMKVKFENEPVNNYYIEPQGDLFDEEGLIIASTPTLDCPNLVSYALSELRELNGPLIVLGSYGIGKTTLAGRIFLRLLEQWEADPSQPVPIYISLQLMQREQSLQGLLGALFTATSMTPGYNFDVFRKLNADGQFALILDGIDEMRQSINSSEFMNNIDELSILTKDNPRSLLLGRPSAFMNEDEYRYVVNGSKGGPSEHYHGAAGYRGLQIALMSDLQIKEFVNKYCSWRYPIGEVVPNQIFNLIWDDANPMLADVAKRPIQMMMIMEIFPLLEGRIPSLSIIYSIFIEDLVKREARKRQSGPTVSNQKFFIQLIAVWLWRRGRRSHTDATQIPNHILDEFTGPESDPEVVRRQLVSASFLSTERGSSLHFPHRSIQEYCVATFIVDRVDKIADLRQSIPWLMDEASLIFTPEICDFLASCVADDADKAPLRVQQLIAMFDHAQTIPKSLNSFLHSGPQLANIVAHYFENWGSIAAMWLCVRHLVASKTTKLQQNKGIINSYSNIRSNNDLSLDDGSAWSATFVLSIQQNIENEVKAYQRAHGWTPDRSAIVFSLLLAQFILFAKDPQSKERGLAKLSESITLLLNFGMIERVEFNKPDGTANWIDRFQPDAKVFAFLSRLSSSASKQRISIGWVYKWLLKETHGQPMLEEWLQGSNLQIRELQLCNELTPRIRDFEKMEAVIDRIRRKFPAPPSDGGMA
jgi:hypothetical protein